MEAKRIHPGSKDAFVVCDCVLVFSLPLCRIAIGIAVVDLVVSGVANHCT